MPNPAKPAPSAQPWPLPSRLRSGLRGAPVVSSTRPSSKSWRTPAMPPRVPTSPPRASPMLWPVPQSERRPGHARTLAGARSRSTLLQRAVTRPAGVRLDTGGCGKGLAADLAAERLGGYDTFVIDAGGDLRLGGEQPLERLVRIDHPLDRSSRSRVPARLRSGGDERDQDPPLAHGQWVRASPPRPIDRASGLDGPDPDELTRHHDPGGGDPGQDGVPFRGGGRARDSLRARWSDRA